ncbi:unnamed protein product [Enterobius vermicularis]|uniref:PDZ domain-containing protein n=1 Tax=Enterobius vermicularis TaxID=51028 RepID=A0A0N4V9A6_ENTVE|nr:unnamed protein product [Enterobius vermicularis]
MNNRVQTIVLYRRCNLPRDDETAARPHRSYRNSLGFSIVGGSDSPRGPMGIFVKSVFNNGLAAHSGLIHKGLGDEVLSVNGVELHGKTHAQALQIFRHFSKVDVTLCIRRPNPEAGICCQETEQCGQHSQQAQHQHQQQQKQQQQQQQQQHHNQQQNQQHQEQLSDHDDQEQQQQQKWSTDDINQNHQRYQIKFFKIGKISAFKNQRVFCCCITVQKFFCLQNKHLLF